jgi:release factor glutamine methyltransferase
MSQGKIWSIKEIIQWSISYLKQAGIDTPRLDTELLLCEALTCRRIDLYLDHDKPLNQREREVFKDLLKRRARHEPIGYILGRKEFYSLSFKVDKDVLLPRPETELLVDLVLQAFPGDLSVRGLDIGTGSGCIVVSIQKNRPNFELEAWDISERALALAEHNARENELVSIKFKKVDILREGSSLTSAEKLDFIVSNPPYISIHEQKSLPSSVVNYEPHIALFAEEEGLAFYSHFAKLGKIYLKSGGKIFLEIGHSQGSAILKIFEDHNWSDLRLFKDLNGIDRVFVGSVP